jgi:hypothetical protein
MRQLKLGAPSERSLKKLSEDFRLLRADVDDALVHYNPVVKCYVKCREAFTKSLESCSERFGKVVGRQAVTLSGKIAVFAVCSLPFGAEKLIRLLRDLWNS